MLQSATFDKSGISVGNTEFDTFDEFLDKLTLWIKENKFTKTDAATKLGISHGLFRFGLMVVLLALVHIIKLKLI